MSREGHTHIVLLTVDSLRADRVGMIVGQGSLTPRIDELRRDSVQFTRACSPTSYTWGAFASLFMSAYPAAVTNRRGVLVTERPTLAEILKEQGYLTAGFNSNPFISAAFGYDRGFDLLEDGLLLSKGRLAKRFLPLLAKGQRLVMRQPYVSAAAMNRQATEWLAGAKDLGRPVFVWLHYMDVHGPYQSKRGWAYRNKWRAEWLWQKVLADPEGVSESEHRELVESYHEEISYTDCHIGRLIDRMKELGLYDNAMVILCADHGDEFFEHGRYSHWRQLHEEIIRVPLLIRHPDGMRDALIDTPVGLIDVVPTIADMLELEPGSHDYSGRSLWPAVRHGDESGLPGFAVGDAMPDREDTMVSIRTRRWKLIVDGAKGQSQLYDLRDDPGEQVDVAQAHSDEVARLEALLWQELGSGRSVGPMEAPAGPDWSDTMEEETLARLQALGYVDWVGEHQRQKGQQ